MGASQSRIARVLMWGARPLTVLIGLCVLAALLSFWRGLFFSTQPTSTIMVRVAIERGSLLVNRLNTSGIRTSMWIAPVPASGQLQGIPRFARHNLGWDLEVPIPLIAAGSAVPCLLGWRLRARQQPGKCPMCGYHLRGLAQPICPECGASVVLEGSDPSSASPTS
jgi:hypothetical protein